MKAIRYMSILLGLLVCPPVFAEDACITLSLENSTVRVYEPLFLSIEDTRPCYAAIRFGPLGSHASDLVLMMQRPGAEPEPYRAPMQLESPPKAPGVGTGQVTGECLVLHGHRCLTSQPGTYLFWIVDRRAPDNVLSNTVTASVVEATTPEDIDAAAKIAENEGQYAAFVYLKGGEHLTAAFETMLALGDGASSYRSLARTMLAFNYCQTFYVGPESATLREKDPIKVDAFFPDPNDASIPQPLKQTLARLATARFDGETVPETLTAKIEATLSTGQ